jgi:hypothetical protein
VAPNATPGFNHHYAQGGVNWGKTVVNYGNADERFNPARLALCGRATDGSSPHLTLFYFLIFGRVATQQQEMLAC